jgi:hypothetical protein
VCTFTADAAKSTTASFTASAPPPPPPPPPPPGYSATISADGPLSHWRLGETSGTAAADAMARHAGTYVNGALVGQASLLTGDTNRAVTLDGTNDHVRVANAAALQLGSAFSLEAWIRPTTLRATGAFSSVVTKAESYSLQFNGSQLEMTVMQSGVRKRLKAPAGSIVADQTYHVVGTYDGSMQRLYVNGALVASAALTGPASSSTYPLLIGSWTGTNEFFAGRVDEVAVYNKVLSAAQVQAHHRAGTATP